MVNFNRVILAGNLTRDPELRFTNSGIPVCSFGLAVNRRKPKDGGDPEVDFFDISAWRELGETIANYKKKGDPILVEGRLQFRSWEDRESGQKRSKVDVVADNIQFLGGRGDGDSANGGDGGQRSRSGAGARSRGGGRDDVDLNEEDFDDIPFAHPNVKRLQIRDIL